MKLIKKFIIVVSVVLSGFLKGVMSSLGMLDHDDEEKNDKEIHLNK